MNAASRRLIVLGFGSWLCYLALAVSARSLHISRSGDHTLLAQLALFAAAFGLYLAAVRVVRRATETRSTLAVIWIGAVLFRLTLLVSDPIEEVDLYRYVWDGAASTSGVNPFRYTPQQVLASSANDSLPPDLARLVALRDESPELTEILTRVHFGELPTIYPPVSQVVFALCSWLTPADSSVSVRLLLMKPWFMAFDLLTIGLVIRLLRQARMPAAQVVTYAWCPLVVKEVANSGHLDSLAMCLTVLAVSWMLSAVNIAAPSRRKILMFAMGSSFALALAVGAKLYPVVLAPLLLMQFARRLGWRTAMTAAACFVAISVVVLWPMRPSSVGAESDSTFDEASLVDSVDEPPLPPAEVSTSPRDPSESVQAFLSRWEMNDFLFLLVIENLRPSAGLPPQQRAWFGVTPETWRQSLVERVAATTGLDSDRVPFLATRLLLSFAFVILAILLAWRATAGPLHRGERSSSQPMLEAAFLTLVWFWLLLPTQNPWYLLWSLPFLPFARSRAWLLLSGLAFVYYVRFWLTAQFPSPLIGTPYPGAQFFDFVVTWLEYVPWFGCLCWNSLFFRKCCKVSKSATRSPERCALNPATTRLPN